jgi:ABC-type transport system involved in multi-copper enzyme maturation permease subunit
VGVSLLYISLFFALGMMISTLTHRPSTALLVSLFVWICWILVIPNLAPVIAKIVAPVPTLQKINAEKVAVDRETNIRVQRVSRNMLGYGKKAEEMRERIEQDGENRKRKLDHFYQEKLKSQIELSKNISRLSPSASFTYASSDLANTGVVLFADFKRNVQRYEKGFRDWADDWHDKFHDDELSDNWFQMEQIPALNNVSSHLDDTVDAVLMDILLMVVFNVLFFMLSYAFFLRYDVT